jgi:hypothetical protein
MMTETNDTIGGRKWVSLRVVVILVGLVGGICAAVVVTDRLSVRNRGTTDATTTHGSGDGSR